MLDMVETLQRPILQRQVHASRRSRNVLHFLKTGRCDRSNCRFAHVAKSTAAEDGAEQKAPVSGSQKEGAANDKNNLLCGYCRKRGHTESSCHAKQRGAPQVLMADQADGAIAEAHIIVANMNIAKVDNCEEEDDPMCERFYADSGANRSLHPDCSVAHSFQAKTVDINTAAGGKTLKAEGVGRMQLRTPNGQIMPGFDQVLFSAQATEKLCSIGQLCDAGFVCLFDKGSFCTYRSSELKINCEPFTKDARDPRNGLYELKLYRDAPRKVDEHCGGEAEN